MEEEKGHAQQSHIMVLEVVKKVIENTLVRADIYDPKLLLHKNREEFLDLVSQNEMLRPFLQEGVVTREYLKQKVIERLGK